MSTSWDQGFSRSCPRDHCFSEKRPKHVRAFCRFVRVCACVCRRVCVRGHREHGRAYVCVALCVSVHGREACLPLCG